jgi:hypothetical protein
MIEWRLTRDNAKSQVMRVEVVNIIPPGLHMSEGFILSLRYYQARKVSAHLGVSIFSNHFPYHSIQNVKV